MNGKTADPSDVRIQIQLQGGKVSAIPEHQRVKHKDKLTWECDHAWAVAFDGRGSVKGPFADNDPDRRPHDGKSDEIRNNPGKDPMKFKYAVAVSDGDNVYIVDPEVIVDPDTDGQ